ncbi:histamine H2 receptor-like isoform X3 [Montipora foliosa]
MRCLTISESRDKLLDTVEPRWFLLDTRDSSHLTKSGSLQNKGISCELQFTKISATCPRKTSSFCHQMDQSTLGPNSSVLNKTQPYHSTVGVYGINTEAIAEFVPIAFITIVVNSVVFVLFLKTKTLRTPANYILFSFAISDFMTGLLNIPLYVIVVHTSVISSNQLRFQLGFLVTVVHVVTAILSAYHIFLATLEMYISVTCPVTHRLVKKEKVKLGLFIVWFVAVFIGFLPFVWIDKTMDPSGTKYFVGYLIFCLVVVFALPYSFILYAFVTIFRALSERLKRRTERSSNPQRTAARERKCAALFVTMAALFAVCWIPYFLLMLLVAFDFRPPALNTVAHVVILIRYITSVTNPLLYSLFRPDFNLAAKRLMKKSNFVGHAVSIHLKRNSKIPDLNEESQAESEEQESDE